MGNTDLGVQQDYLAGVDTAGGFFDAVSEMRDDFIIEHGEAPMDLLVPDPDWHLVDMLVADHLWKLPKKVQDAVKKNGSDHANLTFMGMRLLGTIRIAHVR